MTFCRHVLVVVHLTQQLSAVGGENEPFFPALTFVSDCDTVTMEPDRITTLLNELGRGNRSAEPELIPLIYPELRRMAARYMSRERREHTLQPTALVHEVYLRVAAQDNAFDNRSHFFAISARLMRSILVDHARKRQTAKRGGQPLRLELERPLLICEALDESVLDIDRAISQLADWDFRQAEIVVFRFFGGLTEEEIAEVLEVSLRTVKRDWQMAKAWLHSVLRSGSTKHDA